MFTAFISLLFGCIIGYMAQRSRMCFIGGIRDFILVRDTELLKGLLGFFLTAAVLFPLASAMGGDTLGYPWYDHEKSQVSLDMSRTILGQAPCWIPEESLVVIETDMAKAKGIALPGGYIMSYIAITTIGAGLGIGYLSTIANGCPLRQHVLAASGNRGASIYLAGFYTGAVVYTYFLAQYVKW